MTEGREVFVLTSVGSLGLEALPRSSVRSPVKLPPSGKTMNLLEHFGQRTFVPDGLTLASANWYRALQLLHVMIMT